jgi:hypothetical protein
MDREAAKARERLLQPFGMPKGTSFKALLIEPLHMQEPNPTEPQITGILPSQDRME